MKRYAFTDMAPCQEEYYLEEHAEGAWVRYSDHEQDLRESREVAARNATDAQHLRQTAVQQAATLERVRAAYDYAGNHWADWGERALTVQEMLDAALASQPKAPLRNGPSDADSMPVCVPEAPKGQGDDPDWQDVAQYSNECPQITDLLSVYEQQRRDLAAAKARIAELEEENARLRDPLREQTWAERFRVITERADAAERHVTEWKKLHGDAT